MKNVKAKTTAIVALILCCLCVAVLTNVRVKHKSYADAAATNFQDIRTTAADNGEYDFFTNTREKSK